MNCRVAFGCKGDRSTPVAGVLRLGEGPPQVLSIWLLGLKTFALLEINLLPLKEKTTKKEKTVPTQQ